MVYKNQSIATAFFFEHKQRINIGNTTPSKINDLYASGPAVIKVTSCAEIKNGIKYFNNIKNLLYFLNG